MPRSVLCDRLDARSLLLSSGPDLWLQANAVPCSATRIAAQNGTSASHVEDPTSCQLNRGLEGVLGEDHLSQSWITLRSLYLANSMSFARASRMTLRQYAPGTLQRRLAHHSARVLIVGGGTAGTTVAAQLQRAWKAEGRELAKEHGAIAIIDEAREHHCEAVARISSFSALTDFGPPCCRPAWVDISVRSAVKVRLLLI